MDTCVQFGVYKPDRTGKMGPHGYKVALETRANIMVSLLVTEESQLNIIVDTIVNFSFDRCGLGDYCADNFSVPIMHGDV